MPYYTPLRYPGGKRRLTPVIKQLLEANRLKNVDYAEPYVGGGAIALTLLLEEHASTIHINDLSRPVFAFWHTILNGSVDLCTRIRRTRVSMAEWRRQRAIFESAESASLEDLGFAAFFLNRTNRSGILAGGVIGGQRQNGDWRLNARFNKDELVRRIERIARYRSRIQLYQKDALDFVKTVAPQLDRNAFLFFDPPYIENGGGLYLNEYDLAGHRQLCRAVAELSQRWVLTYDSGAIEADLLPYHRRMVYDLTYSAAGRYRSREVMFLSDGLKIPGSWVSSKPVLLGSVARNGAQIFGFVGRRRRKLAA
jgi:DNA adenine methylase